MSQFNLQRDRLPRPSRLVVFLACGSALFSCWVGWVPAQVGSSPESLEKSYKPEMLAGVALQPALRAEVETALQTRHYERAEAILLDQHEKNPISAPLLVLLGRIFFLDGKYENCAIALKKADKLSPLPDSARFTLAMTYVAMNHPTWARPEIEKLERDNPMKALYPYWVSRLDYHDMHLDEAVAQVQRAIRLDPNFMKAYDNLGLYLEGLGKYDDAIKAYQTAIALDRTNKVRSPWPAHNLGALLTKMGRVDEAEPYLRESLRNDPRFPKAYFQLGLLLEKQRKDDAALRALRQAIEFDADYAEPYLVLGRILQRQHNPAEAQKAFDSFEKLKNDDKKRNLLE
jgi:tetratricopeptide (TPR) repeat protein